MKPVDFRYARAGSLAEAVALLKSAGSAAKLMAGGQTLGPMLNLRYVQPDLVVDITRIPELHRVEEQEGALILGACTTHAAIEDGKVPDVTRGMLRRVAGRIAYRAVRTRGTIGGSLAHADPAADWVSCLSALGADVAISGPGGRRAVPLVGFVRGVLETTLGPDEIIDAIRIPRLSLQARWGYHKLVRKTGEFAHAIGAVVIDRDTCTIVAGATPSGLPFVLELPAADVLDRPPDTEAVRGWLQDTSMQGDLYQMNAHVAALQRALAEALTRR